VYAVVELNDELSRGSGDEPVDMSEAPDTSVKTVRPTKKQQELLLFIEDFINQHGYSPSYREIMQGCHYNSVATVALHVSNLIKRGHLRKRDHSARSIEVVNSTTTEATSKLADVDEQSRDWLTAKVEAAFRDVERHTQEDGVRRLQGLMESLALLNLDLIASLYTDRLQELQQRLAMEREDSV